MTDPLPVSDDPGFELPASGRDRPHIGTAPTGPAGIGAMRIGPAGIDPATVDPAAAPPSGAPVVNIANALTVLRLLLVPVFGVLLISDGGQGTLWRVAAAVTFGFASFTDRIDGQLARRHNLVTAFGTVADPIADKALIGTALVVLSILSELPWSVTVAVLAREVGVTMLRFWVIRHGVIPASRGGKVKTVLQVAAIGLYVLPLTGWPASARGWVMAAAVVVTVVTGADYVLRALRLRATSPRAIAKRNRRLRTRPPAQP